MGAVGIMQSGSQTMALLCGMQLSCGRHSLAAAQGGHRASHTARARAIGPDCCGSVRVALQERRKPRRAYGDRPWLCLRAATRWAGIDLMGRY
jgi:hypothetical protein